jgi:NADH:ubiquinone oxidoreductase subunit 3 (subunit A)
MNKIDKENKSKLLKDYDSVVEAYVRKFEKKHGRYYEYGVGDINGQMMCFINEYYFNIFDIIFDIETKQPKGLIYQWQDDCRVNEISEQNINFTSYSMGLRFEILKQIK